jgi:hypothetical protein
MINPTTPTATAPAVQVTFRRLDHDELVMRGDFVEDGNSGFEPWDGPAGFHAGSFIKTIYRKFAGKAPARKSAA